MKPEKHDLLSDLLHDEQSEVREATLRAGERILRRRRRMRASVRIVIMLAGLSLAALLLRPGPPNPDEMATQPAPAEIPNLQAQELTDEELLALFPETPVGLATLADGRQRLIFPRKEDRERYVGNL